MERGKRGREKGGKIEEREVKNGPAEESALLPYSTPLSTFTLMTGFGIDRFLFG